MTKAKRLLGTFAAATALAAVPGVASADQVRQCLIPDDPPYVSPGTVPNVYVCVEHQPGPGYAGVSTGIQESEYVVSYEDNGGLYICMYRPGTVSCPVEGLEPL